MAFKLDDLMVQIKADNPTYERIKKSDLHNLVEMLKVTPLKAKPAEIIEEMKKISAEKWEKYAKTRTYLVTQLREMVPKGTYADVQFIGYAVASSGVKGAKYKEVQGSWFVQGDYAGTPADKDGSEAKDVENRLSIMEAALSAAQASGKIEKSPLCLKVFVSPEFFFRGARGAYEMDDYQKAIDGLNKIAKKYDDSWIFCFGSVLGMARDHAETLAKVRKAFDKDKKSTDLIAEEEKKLVQTLKKKNASELPAFAVLDAIGALVQKKAIPDPKVDEDLECYNVVLVQRGSKGEGEGHAIVKEFKSTVDFARWDAGGLTGVKSVALYDKVKHVPTEPNGAGKEVQFRNYDGRGVFKLAGVTLGVEICLDHLAKRLKSSSANVQIQLVPSCGMDLKEPSLVACDGGLAFNCDGARPGTRLWEVKGGKKAAEIAPLAEVAVTSPHAATHLGLNAGKVHVYAPQFIAELK